MYVLYYFMGKNFANTWKYFEYGMLRYIGKFIVYSRILIWKYMISEIKSATEIHVSSKISTTHVKSSAIVKSTVVKKTTYLKIYRYMEDIESS